MKYRWLSLWALLALTTLGSAQSGWSRYRVWAYNSSQAQRLSDSSLELFSDEVCIGATDVIVRPGEISMLRALGLPSMFISPLPRADGWSLRGLFDGGDYQTNYLRYNQIIAQYEQWRLANPGLVERVQIGTSWNGRAIWAYRIFNQVRREVAAPPQSVVILGGTHAREWISPNVAMYLVDQLIQMFLQSDSVLTDKLSDNIGVYFVPVANPDGYEYCWTNNRMWRKNRRVNGGGSFGVDLNRNYSVAWGGAGSSSNPSSDTYRGPAAFSEPETIAQRDFVSSLNDVIGMIDFHSYGELILWPWGYTTNPPPNASWLNQIGLNMRNGMVGAGGHSYTVGQTSTTLYLASGTSMDYVYGTYDAPSYTIELRDTGQYGFLLPENQILPTQIESWGAFKRFLMDL